MQFIKWKSTERPDTWFETVDAAVEAQIALWLEEAGTKSAIAAPHRPPREATP